MRELTFEDIEKLKYTGKIIAVISGEYLELVKFMNYDTGEVLEACGVDTTTVTLSRVNAYSAVATGGTHRYSVSGGPARTIADGGNIEVGANLKLDVLYFNESKTGASNYYGDKKSIIVPCDETLELFTELTTNGTTAPTINIYNQESQILTTAINETVGAGDTVSLKFELTGVADTGYPHGGALIFEYEEALFDSVKLRIDGSEAQMVTVPSSYVRKYTNNRTVAYAFPSVTENQQITSFIDLDVDDTNNPPAATLNKIMWELRTNNYFVNDDKGGLFDGPAIEDEDNVPTFRHITNSSIGIQ